MCSIQLRGKVPGRWVFKFPSVMRFRVSNKLTAPIIKSPQTTLELRV